jgi:hypothetical protein
MTPTVTSTEYDVGAKVFVAFAKNMMMMMFVEVTRWRCPERAA